MVMCGHVTNQKHNISSLATSMNMELDKVVTYSEVNATIKLHVSLTTWFYGVT